jgi:hypothetical protein
MNRVKTGVTTKIKTGASPSADFQTRFTICKIWFHYNQYAIKSYEKIKINV